MSKVLTGTVVSTKMQGSVTVEVVRRTPHPLYKKILKKTKKYKVDTNGRKVSLGETVTIVETRPLAKDKHFTLVNEKKKKEKNK